jgi:hypothetical protein
MIEALRMTARLIAPLALALLALGTPAPAADLPVVPGVDPGLLDEGVKRVMEGLAALHQPLALDAQAKLSAARRQGDPEARARAIQAAVDSACIAEVAIDREGKLTAAPGPRTLVLPRHAWRTEVIKVRNAAGAAGVLDFATPQGLPAAGFDRWLDLTEPQGGVFENGILGVPVEYHLIRLHSRVVGDRRAEIVFVFSPAKEGPDQEAAIDLAVRCAPPVATAPDIPAPPDRPKLEDAAEVANRLDPGWTLEDVEALRVVPPAGRNGGDRMIEVHRALPEEWKDTRFDAAHPRPFLASTLDKIWEGMGVLDVEPTRRLAPDLIAAMRDRLQAIDPVVQRARELETFPGGRYPLKYERYVIETKLPEAQNSRAVARLLYLDATARAQAGDIDGGLASARAILGVGRTLGDEPFLISQLVRQAEEHVAIESIEQSLAQGEASDAALAATQAALADEAGAPLLLNGLRGERAQFNDVLDKLSTGVVHIQELSDEGSKTIQKPPKPLAPGMEYSYYRENQALALLFFTRAVEIAKRPTHEQLALWAAFERDTKPPAETVKKLRHALVYLLMPATNAGADAYIRTRAMLRTCELAVGLERLRRTRGRWPAPGDPLAPVFPDGPPLDPFTGKPLRWKATATGLVVYSVGFDRADGGGHLDNKNVKKPGTDLGVRLWDVDRRPRAPRSR